MTKAEIVDIVSQGTGLTKVETQAVIDGFLATVGYALKTGDRVDLRGFGNFKPVVRQGRQARNPRTNEPVWVPTHLTASFRPSKDLKEYLNDQEDEEQD